MYEVRVPSGYAKNESTFSIKKFGIITIVIAVIFIAIMLAEVCIQGRNKGDVSDESNQDDTVSVEYVEGDEDDDSYTNSQYLRSDDNNSLVDHKNFKFDQSFQETQSRDNSSNSGSESHEYHHPHQVHHNSHYEKRLTTR